MGGVVILFSIKMEFVVMLLLVDLVLCQVTYFTIPETESGPAYVFADEGTLNVSVYCVVFLNNEQYQSRWLVRRQIDTGYILPDFNIAGEVTGPTPATDLIGKIKATGELIRNTSITFQTNFTIVNFTTEFDMSIVKCGPQGETLREFNFSFPGMKYMIIFILSYFIQFFHLY